MTRKEIKNICFWIKAFAVAIGLVLLLQLFAFNSCLIPSTGMENSLFQGDRIIINKWSYGLRTPFLSFFSYNRIAERNLQRNDIVVFNNPNPASQHTSIDKREVFISRCAGIPGDTLMLNARLSICVTGSMGPDNKTLYVYPKEKEDTLLALMNEQKIKENKLIGYNSSGHVRNFSRYEVYLIEQNISGASWLKKLQETNTEAPHPFVVPGKGKAIKIEPWNIKLLAKTISLHEGKKVEIKNDTLYVNNHKTFSYIFWKDYYWMVSNNSANLSDSRKFGLVPKDHIIGKASFIWFSKDTEAPFFKGYRWNRFFQSVK